MYIEYADARGFSPLDLHTASKKSSVLASEFESSVGMPVDFKTWLPFAAKKYIISPDPRDYILTPVVSIPVGLPNRNGVGFPLASLLEWSPDDGMQAYRTFAGKPVHVEHENSDFTTAIGVIVDVSLRPLVGFGQGKLWKLVKLLDVDRNKDPEIASTILDGTQNTYSMGAYVSKYTCSLCQAEMGQCSHIDKRRMRDFYLLDGDLVFRNVHGIKGFETSVVKTPAFLSAASDVLLTLGGDNSWR